MYVLLLLPLDTILSRQPLLTVSPTSVLLSHLVWQN